MKYYDRVKQTTTDTGTGNLALGTALLGYRAFSQMFTTSDRFTYVIEEPVSGQWELGIGQCVGSSLIRETPLYGSTGVPVSFASGVKSVYVAHPAPLSQADHMRTFGTGIDGDVVLSGTVTLTQNTDYRNLSFSPGALLVTNGWRVRVSGVCDLTNTVTTAISANGATGGAGTGVTGGVASSLPGGNTAGRGQQGIAGGNGGTAAGSNGTAPAGTWANTNGGDSGASGAGGAGSGGGGGAATFSNGISGYTRYGIEPLLHYDTSTGLASLIRGGAGGSSGGGGGGDGTAGGGGGAGGNGGGVLDLAFAVLRVDSTTFAGVISATGGTGGAGGSPAAGNRGGGGGGAGAGGGYCHLVIGTLVGSKASAINCSGGAGGAGGAKTGTGIVGTIGGGGNGGSIQIIKVDTGSFVEYLGSAGVGIAGGFCVGDL
jgi:hypothetical protein